MTIYLLEDFNKYSNRILKLDDISNLQDKICGTYQNINFVENDGVSAEIILNRNILEASNPDYLMAVGSTGKETDSSWFITSATRLRTGQVKYQLRRDLLRDNWDSIKASQLFISKGYVSNSNPLFFNKESINVNEILTNVYHLYSWQDYVGWLVAYVSKGDLPSEKTNKIEFGNANLYADITSTDETTFKNTYNLEKKACIFKTVYFYVKWQGQSVAHRVTVHPYDGTGAINSSPIYDPTDFYLVPEGTELDFKKISDAIVTYVDSTYTITKSAMDNTISNINNKLIRFTDLSNFYRITADIKESEKVNTKTVSGQNVNMKVAEAMNYISYTRGTLNIINFYEYSFTYSLTDVSSKLDSLTYNNTNHTVGAAYDVICCPYINNTTSTIYTSVIKTSTGTYNLNPDACKDLFTQMSAYLGSSYVYDVQLLPYCPLSGIKGITKTNTIEFDISDRSDYVISEKGTAMMFYSSQYQTEFDINYTMLPWQFKSDYVTRKYKLVAPNFSSELEIDPTKNGGIQKFHVCMTCLPYNPWINIHPRYKYLNGIDADDNRGLICGGSFSLSQLTSAWTEYQYNNSNYSQIFENQLAYQKYQQEQAMWASGISAVTSAIGTGVNTGLMMSAVPGAGAFGAVTGGIAGAASLGAGIADLAKQNEMNAKANQYMTTQYELNLGNIKAQPSTISKITSFNVNTKLFPMIYTYTCTDTEQTMVDNYFKYNGMTINTCGKLEDYVDPTNETFVSARIIRWNDTGSTQSDYNYLNNINTELQEGVYITWQA